MCRKCCSSFAQKIWFFGSGLVLIVIGTFFLLLWPSFISDMVYRSLPLTPTSKTREKWEVIPIPIYMKMYLFNWTNPQDARNSSIKPNFEQVGPYVFVENRTKEDIFWNDNGTVTYSVRRTWFFEPSMSKGSPDDNITCPHLPSIAASDVMRNKGKIIKMGFNRILKKHGGSLYQTHTAMEWLFDGFFDPFLDYAMNKSQAPPIDSNRFAWFTGRNGSKEFDGLYTVHTGVGDLTQMGMITHWNGEKETGFYEGECGKVNGSTGDLWQPRRDPNASITVFVPDTCRFLNLFPKDHVTIEGISGMKYETSAETFDSGDIYPNMKCFCPSVGAKKCLKTGVIDLGPCAHNAPMFLSHSNFLYADPSFTDPITGMNPDPDLHSSYIIMEQSMGIPLEVKADVQINLFIQADKDIDILKGINDFYAPLFIASGQSKMTAELAREIKFALNLPSLGFTIGIVLIFAGAVLLLVGTVCEISRRKQRPK